MKRAMMAALLLAAVAVLPACAHSATNEAMNMEMNGDGGGHGGHGGNGDQDDHGGKGDEAAVKTTADWKLSADRPEAGQEAKVSIRIKDEAGKPVEKFDLNHEKEMHLIAVSEDLSYFDHLHPAYEGGGTFSVATKFPSAGKYKLFADYVPSGGSAATASHWVEVGGAAKEPAAIVPDAELDKKVDGVEAKLSFDSLLAGRDVNLTFHLTDASTGEPIEDLEPYLGAVGHVVIISADTEHYLHVHPAEEGASGPDAKFMTAFPESGVYKIWGQFQRAGKTFIVPFTVKVS